MHIALRVSVSDETLPGFPTGVNYRYSLDRWI